MITTARRQVGIWVGGNAYKKLFDEARSLGLGMSGYGKLLVTLGRRELIENGTIDDANFEM